MGVLSDNDMFLSPATLQTAAPKQQPAPAPKQQPAPSAVPYNTVIPGAALYSQAALAARTAYQNALTRLNDKRQTTLRQYGYTGQIDPETGTVKSMGVDGNNQYGYFQQLLSKGATEAQAAEDAAQSRHLGTHGLGAQGITAAKHQFGSDSAALGQQLISTLGGYQDEQNQAAYTRDQALYQAELEAARAAIDNQQFNPGDLSGLNVDGTVDKTADSNPALDSNPTSNAAKLAALLLPIAQAVSANKTGASKNKKQGIFAIH